MNLDFFDFHTPAKEGVGRMIVSMRYGVKRTFESVIVDSVAVNNGFMSFEYDHNDEIENLIVNEGTTFRFEYEV